MNSLNRILAAVLLIVAMLTAATAAERADIPKSIASLIAPDKLTTLGKRETNPRVQKYVYWLETARTQGADPKEVAREAVKAAGYANEDARKLTVDAMLRNLDIATKLGCLDKEGLETMRRGHSPTVRRGPYTGDKLSVDHIVPRAVHPEFDNVIANLELMPLRMNESKNASMGARQNDLAKKLRSAGLFSNVPLHKSKKGM